MLMPTLAKAKARKKVAELWVIASRMQASRWDATFDIKGNKCSGCDDRLLKLPSPPRRLPGFPHLESVSLYHEMKRQDLGGF